MSLHLSLVTPEASVLDTDVDSVTLPTANGEITILAHHLPLITTLAPGMMTVKTSESEESFAVSRGVVEVAGTHMVVLSDIADRVEELEEEAVEQAKKRAEQLLADKRADSEGFAEATAILDRELARVISVRRRRSRHHS